MSSPFDSQNLESYVPVYDVIPDKWEEWRIIINEQLKKITNSLNQKEIGFFLDEEVLTGKSFVPGVNQTNNGGTSQQFRSVFRKVVISGALTAGVNNIPHGLTIDNNFTLIDLWCAATNSATSTGQVITDSNVTYDSTNFIVNSPGSFDRSSITCEYLQEL